MLINAKQEISMIEGAIFLNFSRPFVAKEINLDSAVEHA